MKTLIKLLCMAAPFEFGMLIYDEVHIRRLRKKLDNAYEMLSQSTAMTEETLKMVADYKERNEVLVQKLKEATEVLKMINDEREKPQLRVVK